MSGRRPRRTLGGSVSASREIPVSAPEAWAVLVDWSRQREWMPLTTVRELGGGGRGARLEAVTGVGPLRVVD
ncbi:MAG TPA: SRPBCC family protein, partial [Actinopolymorphaceae bacterium]